MSKSVFTGRNSKIISLLGGFKLRNLFSKTECKESVNILLFTFELKLPLGEVSRVIALKWSQAMSMLKLNSVGS